MITYNIGSIPDWLSGVGSLAAVTVALRGFFIVEAQRKRDERRSQLGLAFEGVGLASEICNSIWGLDQHIRTSISTLQITSGGQTEDFKNLKPMIGLRNEGDLRLPAGLIELMFKANALPLANDLMQLVVLNRSLVRNLIDYRPIWMQVRDALPKPQSSSKTKVGYAMEFSNDGTLQVALGQIDQLVTELIEQSSQARMVANRVADNIGPALEAYFGERVLTLSKPKLEEGRDV